MLSLWVVRSMLLLLSLTMAHSFSDGSIPYADSFLFFGSIADSG